MQEVTQTRVWRGWLFASVPLLFLYCPLGIQWLWQAYQEAVLLRESGMRFILSGRYPSVPLATNFVSLLPFATALVLAVLFFRWGAHQRPVVKSSLVFAALPWLLGTAHLLLLWRYGVLELDHDAGMGVGGAVTVAVGLGELLTEQASAAFGAALLLASLGAALALDASGVGLRQQARPRDATWTRGALLAGAAVCAFSIVSTACAGFASHAGASFFNQIAMTSLNEWPAEQDAFASRWAVLQAAQCVAAIAALLGLVAGARHRRASAFSKAERMTPWFVGALLAISGGAHLLGTRAVASNFARLVGVTDRGASSAALRGVENTGLPRFLKPVLSVTSEGVLVSGSFAARWDAGEAHVERALADYRQQRAVGILGEPVLPASLDVGVENSATLRAVACLGAAARRVGVAQLALAVGPEHEIPADTRRALSQISPLLGHAFSQRVSVLPLFLDDCRGSESAHVLTVELGQKAISQEGVSRPESCLSHSHCTRLRLTPNSTLDDLLRFLALARYARVEFESDLSQVCDSSAAPL